MSTYQPQGGQQPEGAPPYAQPQDPWAAGHDPNATSLSTEHIPQQHEPYAGGTGPSGLWTAQTEVHGGQSYEYAPPAPARSKAGLIAVMAIVVLVLGGGGGYTAWYVIRHGGTGQDPGTPGSSSTAASQAPPAFDPHDVKVGECLINDGTDEKPKMASAACTMPKSYKVIKRVAGEGLMENDQGGFDRDTTIKAACAGTGFASWYSYKDLSDDTLDLVLCLANNK